MTQSISVLLVDDHDLIRTGIRHILCDFPDIKVVGEADSGEESLIIARQVRPEVVLMDLSMPGMNGYEAIKKLLQFDPDIKILVLTSLSDRFFPLLLFKVGALGYITKGSDIEEIILAIKTVNRGQRYLTKQMVFKKWEEDRLPFDVLSERELQIMLMVTNGTSIQKISENLLISPKTVNSYRYRIYEKLNIQNDVELTLLAVRYDLLQEGKL